MAKSKKYCKQEITLPFEVNTKDVKISHEDMRAAAEKMKNGLDKDPMLFGPAVLGYSVDNNTKFTPELKDCVEKSNKDPQKIQQCANDFAGLAQCGFSKEEDNFVKNLPSNQFGIYEDPKRNVMKILKKR